MVEEILGGQNLFFANIPNWELGNVWNESNFLSRIQSERKVKKFKKNFEKLFDKELLFYNMRPDTL